MITSLTLLVAVHATAETAAPTVPALGANVASWTGWKTFGSKKMHSHDYDLQSVKNPGTMVETAKLKPPRNLGVEALILLSNGPGEGEFVAAEVSEGALTLASNKSVTTNVGSNAASLTPRTVVIETLGVKYLYYPKCYVIALDEPGDNTETYGQYQFMLIPVTTTTVPGGYLEKWYQAA